VASELVSANKFAPISTKWQQSRTCSDEWNECYSRKTSCYTSGSRILGGSKVKDSSWSTTVHWRTCQSMSEPASCTNGYRVKTKLNHWHVEYLRRTGVVDTNVKRLFPVSDRCKALGSYQFPPIIYHLFFRLMGVSLLLARSPCFDKPYCSLERHGVYWHRRMQACPKQDQLRLAEMQEQDDIFAGKKLFWSG
jgi:hypothetical protein